MANESNNNKEISDIIFFRERIDEGRVELELREVGFISEYLMFKLSDSPPIKDQNNFLAKGVNLMQQVQEAWAYDKYHFSLKTDIADYLSNAMTNLLNVNNIEGEKKYIAQLNPENREAFSYGAQIVDALIELAIRTGTINRDSASAWKNLKFNYNSKHNDDVIKGVYRALIFMKYDIEGKKMQFDSLAEITKAPTPEVRRQPITIK